MAKTDRFMMAAGITLRKMMDSQVAWNRAQNRAVDFLIKRTVEQSADEVRPRNNDDVITVVPEKPLQIEAKPLQIEGKHDQPIS